MLVERAILAEEAASEHTTYCADEEEEEECPEHRSTLSGTAVIVVLGVANVLGLTPVVFIFLVEGRAPAVT